MRNRKPSRAEVEKSLREIQELWRLPETETADTGRNPEPAADQNTDTANDTAGHGIRQQAKRLIVGAACWGLLPAGFASWLIRRGGMRRA